MRILWITVSAIVLASCSITPDYIRPKVDMPAKTQTESHPQIDANWWTHFGSNELNRFMEMALAENTDIQASVHRVEQARASLRVARAALFPTLDAEASADTTSYSGRRSSLSGADTNLDSSTGMGFSMRSGDSWDAGLNASYELDLFGKNRAARQNANETLNATLYERDALRLSVMAEVANAYFATLAATARTNIADQNVSAATDLLSVLQAQYDAGRTSSLELAQQKTVLANAKADRETIRQASEETQNALAVLVGKAPHNITVQAKNLNAITLPNIATLQPSDLLERRPDIAQREAILKAAGANIGAARAAFFPSPSLSASWTQQASGFSDPTFSVLSLASSLTAPIFQGGRLQGNLQLAEEQQKEQVEIYQKTVLAAFQETANGLSAIKTTSNRQKAIEDAKKNAEEAYKIAKLRYETGSTDFQTLLDAQRTYLTAMDNAAQAELAKLQSAVTLYKVMGGGWKK